MASLPARAAAVEPVTATGTGVPSTDSRSLRHVPGSAAGGAGASTPGMPSSAMPMGSVTDDDALVLRARTPVKVTVMSRPCTAGKCTGTSRTVPSGPGVTAGNVTVVVCDPAAGRRPPEPWVSQAWIRRRVGTE